MGVLEHQGYKREEQVALGSKFLISNGYIGYRGTLDENDSSDFVALNLNGLFDGETIKESINAYNPLFTMVRADGIILNPKTFRPEYHEISLDTDNGVFRRRTDFKYSDTEIMIKSERFVDQTNKNLIYSKYMFKSNKFITVELLEGIDQIVWNISENHLIESKMIKDEDSIYVTSSTKHHNDEVVVGLSFTKNFESEDLKPNDSISQFEFELNPEVVYTVYKYAGVMHSEENCLEKLKELIKEAKEIGYKALYKKNQAFWKNKYDIAKVEIFNNDKVRKQMEYAVYQLISNRPYSDKVSVGKSGLSGQFHNGSVSWRTEILLLPFYINTDPISARRMVMYRINGLEEAKRKAKKFGYEGAFYPNESGVEGYELNQYNMKNNIHINASIIFGVYEYVERSADYSILFQGGLDMMFECARFYLSYATLSDNKKHYDFLNVRGLDDLHGHVDNEAYTNYMIKNSLDALIKCVAFAKDLDKMEATRYMKSTGYVDLLSEVRELRRKLYTKKENIDYLIESYDKYFNLEDKKVLSGRKINFLEKTRIKNLEETSYLRDANVLILLALFLKEFSPDVLLANYKHYMRRSINPEYLSRIMYIICACENGYPEDAYDMFQKIAHLGIDNEYLFKEGLNLGLLGGMYLAMIYGFAGLKHHVYLLEADYNSSKQIRRIEFKIKVVDNLAHVKIKRNSVSVRFDDKEDEDEEED